MSRDDATDFYDGLAADYHLIHRDWDRSLESQGACLDRLIAAELGPGPHRLLDCSCGIGTQALGLAMRGHRVHATDISPASVARAEREAARRGLDLGFGVADMTALEAAAPAPFDAVVSCDNAFAHLLDDDALIAAARSMAAVARPGGLVLISLRDYDALITERPRFQPPGVVDAPSGERVTFQIWDWAEDGRRYSMRLFLLRAEGEGWVARHHRTRLRALTRAELGRALTAAGLDTPRWHMPEASGYYQPIVTARKPEATPL